MKNKFKKYWWGLLTVIFLLPIGINALYLYNAWYPIFEAPSEWTKFWGGYLGAIISGIVAFIILYIQRLDNQQQNKENRRQNKAENEANRRLAIYQMEKQRIDDVRNVYTQYMTLINTNELLELALKIQDSSPTIITDLRKPMDDFRKANILISLYPLKESPYTQSFIEIKNEFIKSYHSTLNDFDKLVRWSTLPDSTFIIHDTNKLAEISDNLKTIIKTTEYQKSTKNFIYICASRLVKEHVEKYYNNMCSAIQDYIEKEIKDLDISIRQ